MLSKYDVLVTGHEVKNEENRIYIGARYKGQFVMVSDESYAEVSASFDGSMGHLYLNLPPDAEVYREGTP